jgi:hypothetical protein
LPLGPRQVWQSGAKLFVECQFFGHRRPVWNYCFSTYTKRNILDRMQAKEQLWEK